jgi:uncharacterized protein
MILIVLLVLSEVFSVAVLRQHYFNFSRLKYNIILIIHIILSIWLWILFLELYGFDSFYDSPRHIWLLMSFAGMITAVVLPRIMLIIMHFSGKLVSRRGGHIRWLTNTGYILSAVLFLVITVSMLHGRFNFKEENVTIPVKGLNSDLNSLKIVQISDLHLSGFYHHQHLLMDVVERINRQNPDIIINTGDFVSFGWREYGRIDTILSKMKSRYGNFAVLGNHDAGTYNPEYTEADRANNILVIKNLIKSSGYQVLQDEFTKLHIGESTLAIIGTSTSGRHPDIVHGDIQKAIEGMDSADLKILLTHDPNHWAKDIEGKTNIELTFSGHTHGMQFGIMTKNFKWSPAKYIFPRWNGLYKEGNQKLYVNRGLGLLAIPFRIWMPPEITIITLEQERD